MAFQTTASNAISRASKWKTHHGSPFIGSSINSLVNPAQQTQSPQRKGGCRILGVRVLYIARLRCAPYRLRPVQILLGNWRRSAIAVRLCAIGRVTWNGRLSSTEMVLSLRTAAPIIIRNTLIRFPCRGERGQSFRSFFASNQLRCGGIPVIHPPARTMISKEILTRPVCTAIRRRVYILMNASEEGHATEEDGVYFVL